EGKNILIFGSPSASHTLLSLGLIDEIWVFVYPVLIGNGIPLFKDIQEKIALDLISSRTFANGAIALHYHIKRG
ncbi:MAG TPA: dihydrofolate reductase family protein, partial [Chitinophagales bacterium]|nr:dihydrofolate reductase family protein [Chitinophagales bacterium]